MLSLAAVVASPLPSQQQQAVLISNETDSSAACGANSASRLACSCPSGPMKGALFNHISKTGGTAYWQMMLAAFDGLEGHHEVVRSVPAEKAPTFKTANNELTDEPNFQLVYQMDLVGQKSSNEAGGGVITPQLHNNYFIFGLIRKPCEFMLSVYNQEFDSKSRAKGSSAAAKEARQEAEGPRDEKDLFKEWVFQRLNASKYLAPNANMDEAFETKVLSDRYKVRYGDGKVNCMARTETMKEDFIKCAKQYHACGAPVEESHLDDAHLNVAIEAAAKEAQSKGRSAPGAKTHAKCNQMFDAETKEAVMKHEQGFMKRWSINTCCQPEGSEE